MNPNLLEKVKKADFHHINGEYDLAIGIYTELLAYGDDYETIVKKVSALIKLNNLESAIKDSDNAILLDKNRYEGFYYRGICKFYQGNFKGAQNDFSDAQEKAASNNFAKNNLQVWLNKCSTELSNSKINQPITFNIGSVPASLLQQQNEKMEQEEEKKDQQVPQQQTQQQFNQVKHTSAKITYSWYQTNSIVGIQFSFALPDKNSLKIKFDYQKMDISFPIDSTNNYELTLELFEEIVPNECVAEVLLNSIDIKLAKRNKNVGWKRLDKEEDPNKPKTDKAENKKLLVNEQAPSYPTSSKSKKNWDKIGQDIEKEIEKHSDEYNDSGDPSLNVFKKIFEMGDENSRRAMMKSFQESGGTSLSNNWDDAKSKDYKGKDRPEPPKGQEYKKYEH